jgi:hypothetical protein
MSSKVRRPGRGPGRGSDRHRGLGADDAVRKRIAFDAQTWHALHQLSLDSMKSLQELAEEAFRDLLKKYQRPTTVPEMLRASLRAAPANDRGEARRGKRQ